MQRRSLTIIGLELYAFLLAVCEFHIGVKTDEAKYLLNIPYPHPPLGRFVISSTEWIPGHAFWWRLIFATLLVQAVWLLWGMAKDLTQKNRTLLCSTWLLSAAVMYQAGTIMMAVLTGLQTLVFLWLLLRERDNTSSAELIAIFWLASLFTAYQAFLVFPLVAAIFWKLHIPKVRAVFLWAVPIALLVLYTLSNPLAAASMINHAEKDTAQTLLIHLTETAWVLALGGSIALSIVGTIGLFLKPQWGIVLSFLLVCAYVLLSRYDYYAILFTPFFVTGAINIAQKYSKLVLPLAILVPLGSVLLFILRPPQTTPSNVPVVMNAIEPEHLQGDILINGSFGHEWQYESTWPVKRYTLTGLDAAQAVICLSPCTEMERNSLWKPLQGLPVQVFVFRP